MPAFFISDLHLGARYDADPLVRERAAAAFLHSLPQRDCSALYMLGDILDYWFEYRDVVPRGHTRLFGALASLTDAGIPVTWITGNHDMWTRDYFQKELGVRTCNTFIREDILGSGFYLAHGDLTVQAPASYRALQALFHNRMARRMLGSLHPRWTVPLGLHWSSSSREGSSGNGASLPDTDTPVVRRLLDFCRDDHALNPSTLHYMFGHLHSPMQLDGGDGVTMTVLGDWLRRVSFARFDGDALTLHTENF